MFGAFTDHLKQAFDMVWAHGLWRKNSEKWDEWKMFEINY